MSEMTKTEQKILAEAKARGTVCVTVEYKRRGRIAGSRDFNALRSLIDQGLLVKISFSSDHEFTRNKARRKRLFSTLLAGVKQ